MQSGRDKWFLSRVSSNSFVQRTRGQEGSGVLRPGQDGLLHSVLEHIMKVVLGHAAIEASAVSLGVVTVGAELRAEEELDFARHHHNHPFAVAPLSSSTTSSPINVTYTRDPPLPSLLMAHERM